MFCLHLFLRKRLELQSENSFNNSQFPISLPEQRITPLFSWCVPKSSEKVKSGVEISNLQETDIDFKVFSSSRNFKSQYDFLD